MTAAELHVRSVL